MKISFVDEAQHELLDAISFYEEAQPGLGRRFKDELDRRLQGVRDHPEAYGVRNPGYRRLNLTVFPYYIPYILRAETLWGASRSPLAPQAGILDRAENEI